MSQQLSALKKGIECHGKNGTNNTPPEVEWSWMAYMQMGKPNEAAKMLELIDVDTPVEPGDMGYKKRILLNKGVISPEEFEAGICYESDSHASSEIYGLVNYYYHNRHDIPKALHYIDKVLAVRTGHHAFAYKMALLEKVKYTKELSGNK